MGHSESPPFSGTNERTVTHCPLVSVMYVHTAMHFTFSQISVIRPSRLCCKYKKYKKAWPCACVCV